MNNIRPPVIVHCQHKTHHLAGVLFASHFSLNVNLPPSQLPKISGFFPSLNIKQVSRSSPLLNGFVGFKALGDERILSNVEGWLSASCNHNICRSVKPNHPTFFFSACCFFHLYICVLIIYTQLLHGNISLRSAWSMMNVYIYIRKGFFDADRHPWHIIYGSHGRVTITWRKVWIRLTAICISPSPLSTQLLWSFHFHFFILYSGFLFLIYIYILPYITDCLDFPLFI